MSSKSQRTCPTKCVRPLGLDPLLHSNHESLHCSPSPCHVCDFPRPLMWRGPSPIPSPMCEPFLFTPLSSAHTRPYPALTCLHQFQSGPRMTRVPTPSIMTRAVRVGTATRLRADTPSIACDTETPQNRAMLVTLTGSAHETL